MTTWERLYIDTIASDLKCMLTTSTDAHRMDMYCGLREMTTGTQDRDDDDDDVDGDKSFFFMGNLFHIT